MYIRFAFICLCALPLLSGRGAPASPCAVTPAVAEVQPAKGAFTLTPRTGIRCDDPALADAAGLFALSYEKITGFPLASGGAGIAVAITPDTDLPAEGYRLTVGRDGVRIEGSDATGVFYGLQTLLQLIPAKAPYAVAATRITDYPRFGWRGLMLDVSRHFFSKAEVMRVLDVMALHKLNRLHLHLTDNQGWRMEIDRYPRLTGVGAWRADRTGIPWSKRKPQAPGEKTTYGGFFTKDDIREIVAAAAARGIEVVPEIEMPGHAAALMAAYPELGCFPEPFTVPVGSGKYTYRMFCAGRDESFEFLENVLDEVIELFPSRYIHLGGDEASYEWWQKCPRCQKRMRDEGLADEHALQSYFISRIARHIQSRGCEAIGWDEILYGGLAKDAIVMSWRGYEGGLEASAQGHRVIMAPSTMNYLNFGQTSPPFDVPSRSSFVTSLRTSYAYDPVPPAMTATQAAWVMGGQACVWAEFIYDYGILEPKLLPRLGATAEALWSPPARRSWDSFIARQEPLREHYTRLGYRWSEGTYKVDIAVEYADGKAVARFATSQPGPVIRYTTDGTTPTPRSPQLRGDRLTIAEACTLTAAIFTDDSLREEPTVVLVSPANRLPAAKVTYHQPYWDHSAAAGARTLTDGVTGDRYRLDSGWLGFREGVDITFELPAEAFVSELCLGFLRMNDRRARVPQSVTVEALDVEGRSVKSATATIAVPERNPARADASVSLDVRAKSLRITTPKEELIMIDEIITK